LAAVKVYPTDVQGKSAAMQLVAAVRKANEDQSCDVLLLARGGGSIEDLWAFNDEVLAHTISQSVLPIVTGIGHEIDVTIADFVADLRAPTPTAAAEVVSPVQEELSAAVIALEAQMHRAIQRMAQQKSLMLQHCWQQLTSPKQMIASYWQALDHREYRLQQWMTNALQSRTQRLQVLMGRLHAVSPLATLDRGYAVVTHQQRLLKHAEAVNGGDRIDVRLAKGRLLCEVLERQS